MLFYFSFFTSFSRKTPFYVTKIYSLGPDGQIDKLHRIKRMVWLFLIRLASLHQCERKLLFPYAHFISALIDSFVISNAIMYIRHNYGKNLKTCRESNPVYNVTKFYIPHFDNEPAQNICAFGIAHNTTTTTQTKQNSRRPTQICTPFMHITIPSILYIARVLTHR